MAFNYSPKVVTDGLVLYLDAANIKSYPGSGTTWSDISRGGNNGTLVNGPTFSSANGGSIVFDGTNDYVGLVDTFTQNLTIATYIFNMSFSSIQTTVRVIMSYGNASLNYAFNFRLSSTTDTAPTVGNSRLAIRAYNPAASINNTIIGQTNIQPNINYNISFVILPTSYKIYINGVEETLTNQSGTNNGKWINNAVGSATVASIASGFFNNSHISFFIGNVYTAQLYNRALSATEILQNYNATKSRYNLT